MRAVLCDFASEASVSSFLAYRRKHKSRALTLTGARRLAGHLRAIFDGGGNVDDALAMAEEKGWASVEPAWYFKNKGNGNGQASFDTALRVVAADLSAGRAIIDNSSRDPFAVRPGGCADQHQHGSGALLRSRP